MASRPKAKLTPEALEKNVLARLAAGVDYGPEMQRARYEQNKMAYPQAPGPVDEDMDFRDQIAGIMARLNQPMPAPDGSNYYYTQPQYEQAMQQAYPVDPIQQILDEQERRRRMLAARPIPGSAPIMQGRGFVPQGFPQQSTFAGGRDYVNPQGPPMPVGMAFGGDRNALRRSLYPYLQNLGLAIGEQQ